MRVLIVLCLILLSCTSYVVYRHFSHLKGLEKQLGVARYERRALIEDKFIEKLALDPIQGAVFSKENSNSWLRSSQKNSHYAAITKEFFRCRGSPLHSPIPTVLDGKVVENFFDCSGSSTHSLPIREGKEYISPVLLELLNAIQQKTRKQVVITSGHRCPQHHRYVNAKGGPNVAKHMTGACVTFYVVGLEDKPKEVLKVIFAYYKKFSMPEKEKLKYTEFSRSDKACDTSTPPWYNKEILIKFYRQNEGRDGDNSHPFPYFSIQVRFDREKNANLLFQQSDAEHIYRF
jgi:hypothetical protein